MRIVDLVGVLSGSERTINYWRDLKFKLKQEEKLNVRKNRTVEFNRGVIYEYR